MIDWLGGSLTFRLFGLAALVMFVVHIVVQKMLDKCTGGKTAVMNVDEDIGGIVVIGTVLTADGDVDKDAAASGRVSYRKKA